ncbi:hypothetical protein SK128_016912 [Halocaridina rubra]|uniref:Uncharacterized protein n=1 Tax=Halocaridina rubra TaxID=373956 RepID=A0AAN8WPW4_HALRR
MNTTPNKESKSLTDATMCNANFKYHMDPFIKIEFGLIINDAKIVRKVGSENNGRELQEDLNSLHEWSEKWLMKFNTSKMSYAFLSNVRVAFRHMDKEMFRNIYVTYRS